MFNYIKDAVINAGTLPAAPMSSTDELVIKRVGNYKAAGISFEGTAKKYKKIACVEPVNGVYTVAATIPADVQMVHVEFMVRMEGKFLGEYANANWGPFGKKVIVDYTPVAGSYDSVEKKVADLFKLALADTEAPLDSELRMCEVDATGTTATALALEITLPDPYMSITKGSVFVGYIEDTCTSACELSDFTEVAVTFTTTTAPVLPFATGEWLIENLRFPTYYNRRYAAVNGKNYPKVGAKYNQYVFDYEQEAIGLGGLSAVGQKISSVTKHVVYVEAGAESTLFEAELTAAGLTAAA